MSNLLVIAICDSPSCKKTIHEFESVFFKGHFCYDKEYHVDKIYCCKECILKGE